MRVFTDNTLLRRFMMGIKLCSNINRSFQQYIFYTEQHCKNTGDSEKIIYLLPRKKINLNILFSISCSKSGTQPEWCSRAVYSQPVPWNKVMVELWLPELQLTIDQMYIGPSSGKVPVTEDRESAGVRSSVPHHGVGEDQDAGDQLARHLHPHANPENS